MSSVLNCAFLLPRMAPVHHHQQQQHFLFHNRHLLLLLLTLYLATSLTSAVPVAPTSLSNTPKVSSEDAAAQRTLEDQNLLLAPASSSAPEWAAMLAKMTAENPCGSSENYSLCQQCGKSTGDPSAFYLCCVNSDDVRQFCYDFVNHTIP